MSSQAVAWAISHDAGSGGAKAALLSIANYANEYGECWASQATLAAGANCSDRQLRRILSVLQSRGLIAREKRGGSGKGRDTDVIRLRMRELPVILSAKRRDEQPDIIADSPQTQPDKMSGSPIATGQDVRGATGQKRGGYRTMMSDNPKNPKKNPLYPPGFEEAWKLWPKHVRASSKRLAIERLRKLDAGGAEFVAAVRAYLQSPDATKDNRRFVPAFEVWLNRHAEFWLEQSRPDERELQNRLDLFAYDGTWHESWGPRPPKAQGGQA